MSAINCPLCQKSFKSTSSLKIHENIHSRRELFQCKECNRSFTQAGNLKIHLTTHTEERPFECLQCKKKFAREQILENHLKIHTKRTRDNKCPICPKAFFDNAGLRNHTHKVHDNEKRSAFMEKKYVWAGAFFYRFQVRS